MLQQLTRLFKNDFASSTLSLILAVYAAMAGPKLPEPVAKLFENAIFRMCFMALILYMSGRDLKLAIMVAVAFSVTMTVLNEQRVAEGFVDGIKQNMNDNFNH